MRQIAELGQSILRNAARIVDDPGDAAIQRLIDDLLEAASETDGVGIAAPQLFESRKLFVISSRPNPRYPHAPLMEPVAIVNPEILWTGKEVEKDWEGCLSIPGLRGLVPRYRQIGVRFLDRRGRRREEDYSGFVARIFQHEFDHLQGRVFIDRMEDMRDLVTEKEYRRILSESR